MADIQNYIPDIYLALKIAFIFHISNYYAVPYLDHIMKKVIFPEYTLALQQFYVKTFLFIGKKLLYLMYFFVKGTEASFFIKKLCELFGYYENLKPISYDVYYNILPKNLRYAYLTTNVSPIFPLTLPWAPWIWGFILLSTVVIPYGIDHHYGSGLYTFFLEAYNYLHASMASVVNSSSKLDSVDTFREVLTFSKEELDTLSEIPLKEQVQNGNLNLEQHSVKYTPYLVCIGGAALFIAYIVLKQ